MMVFLSVAILGLASAIGSSAPPPNQSPDSVSPAIWIENQGQWPAHVRFLAETSEGWIRAEEKALVFQTRTVAGSRSVVRIEIDGLETAPFGVDLARPTFSYFIGNDPDEWRGGVPSYDSVSWGDGLSAQVIANSLVLQSEDAVVLNWIGATEAEIADGFWRLGTPQGAVRIQSGLGAEFVDRGTDRRIVPIPKRFDSVGPSSLVSEDVAYQDWSTLIGGARGDTETGPVDWTHSLKISVR